jgi:hypothetical protein
MITSRDLLHQPSHGTGYEVLGEQRAMELFSTFDRATPEFRDFVRGVVAAGLYILEQHQ